MYVSSTYQISPTFSQCWGEFGLPRADCLVTEHDAADQEHLRQIAQTEFVAQSPEHHERDDVGRVLRPIEQGRAAFVELFAAAATAKSAVALRGPLAPFRTGYRAAPNALHLSRAPTWRRLYPGRCHLNRRRGARGEHANLWGPLRHQCDCFIDVR